MRRREFITLLCSAAVAWPLSARAQQPARIPRIGFLGLGPASAWTSRVEALRQGLRDLGYIEGKNIVIEFRWADGVDQLAQFAAEFVRMNVDTASSTMVEAARQATKTIPIVFAYHAAPVGLGHVASLARPGGNITALANLLADLVAKDLEILMEALPQAKRVGVLWNPTNPSHQLALKAAETAGEKLGVKLVMVPARSADDFEGAFSTMSREGVTGLLVVSSPLSVSQSGRLAALALKYRLPGMFAIKIEVGAGGLMSYGADITDQFRRAALYIDKILKGVKPADLPMEQASKYQLVINLKTAKALGLTIPPTLLVRADEVIE
jgi:putative tryptophan/tyrosine transport system substrate-binding protein